MEIVTVKQDGLSHLSYVVISKDKAVIIDPRRDADIYLEIAQRGNARIELVLESHRNEDYVIGSIELKHLVPTIRIGHSNQTRFGYGDLDLSDEEFIRVGDLGITCMQTPGHTDDSISYAVADLSVSEDPIVCFTGDTLFVGNVGRTDLVDPKLTEANAHKLYNSLHEKLMKLDDGVVIYPGHGAGSVCGGEMAAREFSTIGYERRHNPWLQLDETTFVERACSQDLVLAKYFKHCEKLNTDGPPLVADIPAPQRLTMEEFRELSGAEDAVIVDTRSHESFASMYIPSSISLPMSILGLVAGWVVRPDEKILLVLDRKGDLDPAFRFLVRVGLDNIVGYLGPTLAGWAADGGPVESLRVIKPEEVRQSIESGDVIAIDVREKSETLNDSMPQFERLPLTLIRDMRPTVPDRPVVTLCPVGVRATTGASILRRMGVEHVMVSPGGIEGLRHVQDKPKREEDE